MKRRVLVHVHDTPEEEQQRVTLKSAARAALAQLPDVKTLELVRGNGYFYVVGEFKSGRPITSEGIYTNRLNHKWGVDWWVNEIKRVVNKERPTNEQTHDGSVITEELLRRGAEYEGRLFSGGAYSAARLRWKGMAPDAPMRDVILRGRENYNSLRRQVGLPEVTNWDERPAQTMEQMLRRFLSGGATKDVDFLPMPVPVEELKGRALTEKIAEVQRTIEMVKEGRARARGARALGYQEELDWLNKLLGQLNAQKQKTHDCSATCACKAKPRRGTVYVYDRSSCVDGKWTGTYTANVNGKSQSLKATVEAPDAYEAGDRLRELFEKKYGTNFAYPVVRFEGGPKRLSAGSISQRVAAMAGPEE